MKGCSTQLVIREMHIKATMRYNYTPTKIAKIQKTEHTKCWRDCGETEILKHYWWECIMI